MCLTFSISLFLLLSFSPSLLLSSLFSLSLLFFCLPRRFGARLSWPSDGLRTQVAAHILQTTRRVDKAVDEAKQTRRNTSPQQIDRTTAREHAFQHPRLCPHFRARGLVDCAQFDAIVLCKHHLQATGCDVERTRLLTPGWRSKWTLATLTGRSAAGTHGGTAWLRRIAYTTTEFLPDEQGTCSVAHEFNDCTVFLWRFHDVVLAFIVLYSDSGPGLEGMNRAKLAALARVVAALRVPWLAAGDYTSSEHRSSSHKGQQRVTWLARKAAPRTSGCAHPVF